MGARKVKFEYYQVVCTKRSDGHGTRDRLFDMVRWMDKATRKSLEARTYDYKSEQARLDRAYFDDELQYYFLHFVRLRDTNIPSLAKKQSEVEPIELEDDEYLGEGVSAIYIQFEKETEVRAFVTFIHYNPLDTTEGLGKTQEELLLTGTLIESIPSPERREGKEAKPYFNPQTKELWYEYTDRPLTAEEKITKMKAQLKITQDALDALLLE